MVLSSSKYLGSIFTQDGRLERGRNRTQKGNVVCYELALLLKHTSIPMETNAKLINSIFTSTLTYQCRTWTLTKRLERKIATCKKRDVCVGLSTKPGKTRSEMRSEKVREMVGTTPIQHHIGDRGLYVSGT